MNCRYCGQGIEESAKTCLHCGGPNKAGADNAAPTLTLNTVFSHPDYSQWCIFYNGYVIWRVVEDYRDAVAFYFFLGRELTGVIKLTLQIFRDIVPNGADCLPYIWELFEATYGKEEIGVWRERNTINAREVYVTFTRHEAPKMTFEQVKQMFVERNGLEFGK